MKTTILAGLAILAGGVAAFGSAALAQSRD